MAMKQEGCTKVAVANDKEAYGAGLATLLELQKGNYGDQRSSATPASTRTRRTSAPTRRRSRRQGADCFFFAGHRRQRRGAAHQGRPRRAAERQDLRRRRRLHRARSRTRRRAASRRASIRCFSARSRRWTSSTYPGGKDVPRSDYKAKYGDANPDPYAIYGYEAMQLALDAIASSARRATTSGRARRRCSRPRTASRCSARTAIDENGDTTLKPTACTRSTRTASPTFDKTIKPTRYARRPASSAGVERGASGRPAPLTGRHGPMEASSRHARTRRGRRAAAGIRAQVARPLRPDHRPAGAAGLLRHPGPHDGYSGSHGHASDHDLTTLGKNLDDGISNGAIWALVAIGYTLVYGIIELINFAHGDVFMIGSFVAVGLLGHDRARRSTTGAARAGRRACC